MRILFIHEVNYVSKVIFEMHEFPELLALRGHEVSFFHFPEAPSEITRSIRTRRRRIPGRVHPTAELQLITPPTFGGRSWERYLAPLFHLPALWRTIRRGNFDVIVLYAVPTTGWQTIALAKRARIPVVFRALDVSHKIRASPLSGLVKLAEKYIYRNAAILSAHTPAMIDYCVQLSGRIGRTSVDVPPIDLSHFERPVDTDLHESLGLAAGHRVVLYMGSFFSFSGLDVVLETLVDEFARHPELRLVLVGGGEIDARLRSLARSLGIDDKVIFTGVVPYSRLPEYLKLADVAINPFNRELLTDVALPHKVLQYMAAGTPAVSTALRGLRGVLGEASGVSWGDSPEAVARIASTLAMGERKKLAELSALQLITVHKQFSMNLAVSRFEETLKSVG